MMFFVRFLVLWLINFLSFGDNQLWNKEIESSVGYNWICTTGIMFVNLDGSCALIRFNVAFEASSLNNVDNHKDGCNKLLRFTEKIVFLLLLILFYF